ncbi:hypothetical protein OHA40_15460 [Nocardia sp. NBC_00508]|uniref:hypothetical protein n=1 Tax=Nocardia sp. NBC_00508 TaxID=2975992 RepID=UPI002E81B123|nr:hypothetical protein [Nocardia sp. NBC_00508]WUD69398.1 hypothetical protein OHA40_15460 [Nocardia sp. NBC_00508]
MSRSRTESGSHLAPTELPAIQDAFTRCRRYRQDNRLYAVVDAALGRIMLEVGSVGAVVMPTAFGRRVHERLIAGAEHRPGPIIAHPRSDRWTFLTGPTDNSYLDTELFADLFRYCASIALPGSHLVLPSPTDEHGGYRVWAAAPDGDFRREFGEVIATTRACAAATGASAGPAELA